MTNKIFVNKSPDLDAYFDADFSPERLIQFICEAKRIKQSHIEISFVSLAFITDLHETYFMTATPTDTITFTLGSDPGDPAEAVAGYQDLIIDGYICPEYISQSAPTAVTQELNLVVTHSVLHGIGYTDTTPAARAIMFAAQDRLLRAYYNPV